MFCGTIDKTDGADGELITIDDARCEVIPTAQKGQASGGRKGRGSWRTTKPDTGQDIWKDMGIERENVKIEEKKIFDDTIRQNYKRVDDGIGSETNLQTSPGAFSSPLGTK